MNYYERNPFFPDWFWDYLVEILTLSTALAFAAYTIVVAYIAFFDVIAINVIYDISVLIGGQ